MIKQQHWQQQRGDVSEQGFLDLFANKCGYICVENFFSSNDCTQFVKALREMGLNQYDYQFDVNEAPQAAHLFTTHYLYENLQPDVYFPEAKNSIMQYQNLIQQVQIDPIQKMMALLSQHLQKTIHIAEQNGQQYSYLIARELNHSALLHADYARFIPSYWSISTVMAQYAWNIYLTDPGQGGETVVYNKPWEKEDDDYILAETYGYDKKIVADKEFITFSPQPGALLFFNSRNFHEVKKCSQPRLTIGGHIGLTDAGEIIMWV